ncbi:hypothetical protein FOVSG1_008757 [Fusarium oxysporum f. sp. vasinfectum]
MPAEISGRELDPEEMIPMGRRRYARVADAIHQHTQVNHGSYRTPPTLSPFYRADCSSAARLSVNDDIETTLANHSEPQNGYILVNVDSTTPDPRQPAPYSNYVHEEGRVIMCMFNYRYFDPRPRSEQMKWADTMAASCVEALSLSGRAANLAALTSIWRISIGNKQTQTIIGMLRAIHKSTGGPFEVTPAADDLFFALLESDHGKGVASLLIEYPWMFGFKTITSATIFPVPTGSPSLYWRPEPLAERPPELPPRDDLGSSPMSKKQARKHRKTMSKSSINSST